VRKKFAAEHGVELCRNEELVIPREVERLREYQQEAASHGNDLFAPSISHDTVGAVALDRNGNIAAATSTGGTLNKAPGRLGDSSLIGCVAMPTISVRPPQPQVGESRL